MTTTWSLGLILAALLTGAGCAGWRQAGLTVLTGERVVYECQGDDRIGATYYSLSDGSLEFVKVRLPGGKEVTLPQALSASGVRYTDDREWVWWTKGTAAFAETREPDGTWRVRYRDCRQTVAKP